MNIFMIARSNMKKKKNSMILIFILVLISSMFLYTGLNVLTSVNKFLDKRNKELNGADFVMISYKGYKDNIMETFRENEAYDYSEEEDVVTFYSIGLKNLTKEGEQENLSFIFSDWNKERSISILDIVDKDEQLQEDSAILPEYFQLAKGYNIGDEIELETNFRKYNLKVAGFSEDIMFPNPTNIALFKVFVSNDMLKELNNDLDGTPEELYSVKLKENYSSSDFEDEINLNNLKRPEDKKIKTNITLNYETMKMGTGIFINIIMAIISVFAIIIVIISAIVIIFSIKTSIQSNMKNIGLLEAIGYTTKELRRATILEYLIITIFGTLAGFLVSIAFSKLINKVVSGTMGLRWQSQFNLPLMFYVFLFVIASVLLVVLITSKTLKNITPLVSLRDGIDNHNFKKNYLPLEKSKLEINSLLGIKEIFHNKKQNIAILIIVIMLSFICSFAMAAYYNFLVNQNCLINLIGMEKPNIMISFTNNSIDNIEKNVKEVAQEIEKRSEVKDINLHTSKSVILENNNKVISMKIEIVGDFNKLKVNTILQGRKPKYDNEIMVSNVTLKDLDAKLGDTIYLERLGERREFIVVGVYQQISNMGKGAKITEEGMEKLTGKFEGDTLYVYLNKEYDVEKFKRDLSEIYEEEDLVVVNFDDRYDSILNSFKEGVKIITIVSVFIALVVITLILFMFIKIKLLRDRQIFGIYKALGYTSRELIWQITMNFTPVIFMGALMGVVIGKFLINPAFTLVFAIAGIEKSTLNINFLILLGTLLFIVMVSLIVSIICARKVKTIEAYKMITE